MMGSVLRHALHAVQQLPGQALSTKEGLAPLLLEGLYDVSIIACE